MRDAQDLLPSLCIGMTLQAQGTILNSEDRTWVCCEPGQCPPCHAMALDPILSLLSVKEEGQVLRG